MKVVVLKRALMETREIVAWWRENRTAAPFLFENELADLFDRLRTTPNIGQVVDRKSHAIRMNPLIKSRYDVYHRVSKDKLQLEILAIWHMSRRGPKL